MRRRLPWLGLAIAIGCGAGRGGGEVVDGGEADAGAVDRFDAGSPATGAGRVETAARYLAELGDVAVFPIQDVAPPPPRGTYDDLAFHSRVTRVAEAPLTYHVYSQLQAFARDDAHLLLLEGATEDAVGYVVRRWPTLELVLDSAATAAWNVPRWHPADPRRIVHFDSNGDDVLRLQQTHVETGVTETLFTFPAPHQRIRGNQSFDEISRAGAWLAGMTSGAGGATTIFTFDLDARRIGAEIDLDALYSGPCTPDPTWGIVEPDWIGVSPLGRYLVIQWPATGTGRCQGLETFDVATGAFVGRVISSHPHADLTVLSDGDTEVFVTQELRGPGLGESYVGGVPGGDAVDANYPAVAYRVLPGPAEGEQPPSYLYLTDWVFEHVSCRGPFGWCLVTAGQNPANGAFDPLEGELYLVRLDGRGIVRLAHHRSSSAGYWQQPRASISHGGRYVIFDSDWGTAAPPGPPSSYVIDLSVDPAP